MAKLKINDIKPTGTELFVDSESFMNELMNDELGQVIAGRIIYPNTTIDSVMHSCLPTCTIEPTIIKTGPISPVIL